MTHHNLKVWHNLTLMENFPRGTFVDAPDVASYADLQAEICKRSAQSNAARLRELEQEEAYIEHQAWTSGCFGDGLEDGLTVLGLADLKGSEANLLGPALFRFGWSDFEGTVEAR